MKEMEQKQLSKTSLLLVPLVLPDDRLIEHSSFIGAFNICKDMPWMEDHIFLLFNTNTIKEQIEIENLFSNCEWFHSLSSIRINCVWYTLAVFNIPPLYKKTYSILKLSGNSILTQNLFKLYIQFWKRSTIIEIENYLYDPEYNGFILDKLPLRDSLTTCNSLIF